MKQGPARVTRYGGKGADIPRARWKRATLRLVGWVAVVLHGRGWHALGQRWITGRLAQWIMRQVAV